MERNGNWQQFILDRPMAAVPGTTFNDNRGNSHLLSTIFTATGRNALDFAREQAIAPLGIEDVVWRADPQGISGVAMAFDPPAARHGWVKLAIFTCATVCGRDNDSCRKRG